MKIRGAESCFYVPWLLRAKAASALNLRRPARDLFRFGQCDAALRYPGLVRRSN